VVKIGSLPSFVVGLVAQVNLIRAKIEVIPIENNEFFFRVVVYDDDVII
jgi:hypothetical protein